MYLIETLQKRGVNSGSHATSLTERSKEFPVKRFQVGTCFLLLLTLLTQWLWPATGAAYDLSHSTLKKTPKSPFSVALVPFAETRTRSLDGLIDRMHSALIKTKGTRVMDQNDTEEILRYYLKYVNATAVDDSTQRSM